MKPEKVKKQHLTSVGASLLNPGGFLDDFLVSGPRALPPIFFLKVHQHILSLEDHKYELEYKSPTLID